ncbi:unnamed protein product [Rodentolepis nana]|uniref:Deacetylase sirtuin-type domain-containing protein n=1 Tax=Rodentolepis nana TaxID=102285 RepID=A0A0R3TMG4_RODNA|nr:unnamed protein product [Rodentolepis nana]
MNDKIENPEGDPTLDRSEDSQNSDVIIVNDEDSDGRSYENSLDSFAGEDDDEEFIDLSDEDDCEIMWKNPALLGSLISAGYRNPRLLLTRLFKISPEYLPPDPCEHELWRILSSLFAEKSSRKPLKQFHSLEAAINLLKEKSKILVLTGAGISVSCGIPDFRSRNGVYARLKQDFPDLRNPQDMFDLKFFKSNPNPFYTFAKELFPGQFKPSYTHRFIRLLEKKSKLLRNYTQNIDTLEEIAGISKIIHCHGSFATASCLTCHSQLPGEELREAIMSQHVPFCPHCRPDIGLKGIPAVLGKTTEPEPEEGVVTPLGLMKPDIVFFSESLSQEFHYTLEKDVKDVDLVLVMGSSLKVRPVSHIPNSLPNHVPQILINREPLSNHQFDVELLGECDVIVEYLCKQLGWDVDMDDASVESVPEGTPVKENLKQVDLLVPMKAALEDLAIQPDLSNAPTATSISGESADQPVEKRPSIDEQENVSTCFGPEAKKITDNDTKDTITETAVAEAYTTGKMEGMETKEIPVKTQCANAETSGSDAHNVLVEGKEEQARQRSEGTARCPIDVDEEGSDSYLDDFNDDGQEKLDNIKIVQLAKYLPENTFTCIPRRLYIFKGSELAISSEMIEEYVKGHSEHNGVSNGSIPDSPISDSSSESSEDVEDNGDLVACILQRCQNDPILEAERKRCLEEEAGVEVIDCDESPPQNASIGAAVAATDSENPHTGNTLNSNGKKRMSSESPCDGSSETKRRKTCEDGKEEEKSNICPTEMVDTVSDSVSDEKTVNASQA